MCHVSRVTIHLSRVTCHKLDKQNKNKKMEKVVVLVGGGSVINVAYHV